MLVTLQILSKGSPCLELKVWFLFISQVYPSLQINTTMGISLEWEGWNSNKLEEATRSLVKGRSKRSRQGGKAGGGWRSRGRAGVPGADVINLLHSFEG